MNKIIELVSKKDWSSIFSNYSIDDVVACLSFREAMNVVKHLFYDDIRDDEKQQYALKLAFKIEKHFKNDWEKDWKNDVFLGGLCVMLWLYDEQYFFYKRAYDKLKDPPAELLYLLSSCSHAPGTPPITNKEADLYLKRALEKKVTSDVALGMRNVSREKNDKAQEDYWDQMYEKLKKENVHLDQLIPDVLK